MLTLSILFFLNPGVILNTNNHHRLLPLRKGKIQILVNLMLRIYNKKTELKRPEYKQKVFTERWNVKTFDEYPFMNSHFLGVLNVR